MNILVDVYATEGGEYLGEARFLGEVTIASVTKPDPSDKAYTDLRESGEITESFEFIGPNKSVFYGFEYFVRFRQQILH
jgi:hypothetical protein